jgi:LPS export ABC transporter protein LptC
MVLGLVLAGLVGGGAYLWWQPAPPPPTPKPQAAPAPQSQMESLNLTEIIQGNKRWALVAEKAEHAKEKDQIILQGVRIDFFEDSGIVTRVKAQEGVIHTKSRMLVLKGRVEASRGELRIVAESFNYQPKERVLVAHGEVILEGPAVKIEGKGLTVNLAKHKLTLNEHRRTEVKVAGKGMIW